MDGVTARFHIPTRYQDWNETIYEITPAMKHFTLLFPRLSKAFNCCKMIGSHARWWNDVAFSGNFIPFHRVGNNAQSFTIVKLLPSLSSSFYAKSAVLLTCRFNKCTWHPGETSTDTGLRPAPTRQGGGWFQTQRPHLKATLSRSAAPQCVMLACRGAECFTWRKDRAPNEERVGG